MVEGRGAGRARGRGVAAIGPTDAVAGALLLAALLEAQGARAEGLDARTILAKLSDLSKLTSEEADLLHLAVAIEAPQLLTEAELAAVLDPQTLIDLGLTPEFVADLLDDGPELALQRLKEAFAPKLKAALASVERKAFSDEAHLIKVSAQSGGGGEAAATTAAAGAGAAEGGLSPLALLAGAAGLGAIGVAVGGGGGSSSGNSPANVNDAPTTAADTVAATEDTAVTFDVRTNDSDLDGDALNVTAINGTAITTTTPVTIANVGTVALNANGTLTFTPVANFNGAPSIAYTISDGRGGTATGTATVNVAAVNDAPVNTVPAATLAASAGVGVAVAGMSVADVDGGNLTTTLALGAGQGTLAIGTVAGGATITGSGTASVAISGSIAQINASLGAVSFTSATGFSGNATLTVSTSDGTLTDVDARTIAVARVQTGVVSDGYVSGATVFIDVNGNGVRDALGPGLDLEPLTTTNADGTYSFASNLVGPIVATGGTNIDTGLPNTVTLTAPVGSTVINPLTTIVQSLVSTGVSAETATMQVAVALGLPATTKLGSYDILAQPKTDAVAIAAQKAATQVVTLLNTAREAAGSSNAAAVETAVVTKLATAVTAAVSSTGESTGGGNGGGSTGPALDLTSTGTLTGLLSNVAGISEAAVMTTATKTASINQTIQSATDLDAIATKVLDTTGPNVNLAPAAEDDIVSVADIGDDETASIDLLANDLDPEGDALSLTSFSVAGVELAANVRDYNFGEINGYNVKIAGSVVTITRDIGDFLPGGEPFILTYVVTDARGASSTASFTFDFGAETTNQTPVATNDSYTLTPGQSLSLDVLANDLDVDGDELRITAVNGRAVTPGGLLNTGNLFGTISATSTGITFNAGNRFGEQTFTYTIADASGATSTATVKINIPQTNQAPVTAADTVAATEDTPVTFDVRSNDDDADDDALTVTAINGTAITTAAPVTLAGIGTVALNANGTLTFTPLPGISGETSFTYTVADDDGETDEGTVNLNVTAVNDAPVTVADAVAATEDSAVTFDVRTNDSDADGDALTVTAINGTAIAVGSPVAVANVGSVALNANGTLTFTPLANFNGTPSFTYIVSDGFGGTATGTVNLNVAAVNDAPAAAPNVVATSEDAAVTFDVRTNDSDIEGDALTVTAINGTAISVGAPVTVQGAGTVALNANGTLTFTPLANANGTRGFNYTVSDGKGGTAVSSVNVNIAAVNDAPVANANNVAASEDSPITFDVRTNDSDPEGDALAVTAINGTAISVGSPVTVAGAGTVALNANGTLTFTPLANINGARSFSYTVSDGKGGTATANATLNIASVNDAPAAATDSVAVTEDTLATFDVRTNDSDVEGGTLSVTHINGVAVSVGSPVTIAGIGTVGLNANGTLNFMPQLNVNGTKSFSYTLSDGQGGSSSGTVNLNIAAVADGTTFEVAADDIGYVIDNADDLAAGGVGVIDVDGPGEIGAISITDGEAAKLINAGLSFDTEEDVTVVVATQLSTSLQSLQALGVDSVEAAGSVTAIDVDAGSLGALTTGSLPQFDVAQDDSALDVTLNIDGTGGALFAGVADPQGLIAALGGAGIDHINLDGSGTIAAAQISGAQATQLIDEGIDFAGEDVVTVAATTMSNSLQSLQTLGVDSVAVVGGATAIAIDAGGLAALSATGLPQFDVAQSDAALDVTLNVDGGGELFAGAVDPLALIAALGGAGIDHLDIDGDGSLGTTEIDDAQAEALVNAGLDFAGDDTINVVTAGTQLGTTLSELQTLGVDSVTTTALEGTLRVEAGVTSMDMGGGGLADLGGQPLPQFEDSLDVTLMVEGTDFGGVDFSLLADTLVAAGIDHIDFDGVAPPLGENQAIDLIAAGLDFAADANVSVQAASTELSTSLQDLQALGVDSVGAAAGPLTVQLGDGIDGLAALPQFDVLQSDGALDVTLEIGGAALAAEPDLGTLLGVDVLAGLTTPDLYGDLIDALITAGIDRINLDTSGRVELADGLADVLIAFEGFTADDAELVLNAAGSGDHLRTSLHEMAHLGVDAVELDDQGADPVYVDFGDGPLDETTLLGMLDALDSDNDDATPLFTGSAEVALVVDQATAEAIAQASGALDKLAELGFTEITVLDGVDNSFIGMLESGPLEVKLIGQDDDLYDYLHH